MKPEGEESGWADTVTTDEIYSHISKNFVFQLRSAQGTRVVMLAEHKAKTIKAFKTTSERCKFHCLLGEIFIPGHGSCHEHTIKGPQETLTFDLKNLTKHAL
ncbi:hypothetical protein Tcan_05081 [Toxocara canis]|uniref:Uncharacterized protein n=1 Tax=Toxocara canis TaxID=6265 RepID=A0A0B2V0Q6_TOXCA|nr:hypothetical protein Tcan_05081 [Toxocara canis]